MKPSTEGQVFVRDALAGKCDFSTRRTIPGTPFGPQFASFIMDNHNENNRRVSKPAVENIVKSFLHDGVRDSASIQMDWNGNLLNGQHRMKAVIETGLTLICTLELGQDPDNYKIVNTDHRATNADRFGHVESDRAGPRAKIGNELYRIVHGTIGTRGAVSSSEQESASNGFRDAITFILDRITTRPVGGSPLLAVLAYCYATYPKVVDMFIKKYNSDVVKMPHDPVDAFLRATTQVSSNTVNRSITIYRAFNALYAMVPRSLSNRQPSKKRLSMDDKGYLFFRKAYETAQAKAAAPVVAPADAAQ